MSLSACQNESLKIDNEIMTLEIEKAPLFHSDFTNRVKEPILAIDAERMNFQKLFAILLKADTSNISVKNSKLNNDYFKIDIHQKDDNQPIHQIASEKILEKWNLSLITIKNKTYQIELIDSTKHIKYHSNSDSKMSKVITTNDSIKIENCDLKKLAEILSLEYAESIISGDPSSKIDYNLKKDTFQAIKTKIESDLGVKFIDLNKAKFTYVIEDK
jgi:hypothetical protein